MFPVSHVVAYVLIGPLHHQLHQMHCIQFNSNFKGPETPPPPPFTLLVWASLRLAPPKQTEFRVQGSWFITYTLTPHMVVVIILDD